jgi:hypothetical protein
MPMHGNSCLRDSVNDEKGEGRLPDVREDPVGHQTDRVVAQLRRRGAVRRIGRVN